MSPAPTREESLAAFDAARRDNQQFLATIPRERMLEAGATGSWSVKDVLAHVAAWRERTILRLEAAAAGKPEPPAPWPDGLTEDDEINAWFYEQHRNDSLDDVLKAWNSSFDRLRAAFVALPESVLYDANYFSWLGGNPVITALPEQYMSHFNEEHKPTLEAWLAGKTT